MEKSISEQVREYVKLSGLSLYKLSNQAGIGHKIVHRFVAEEGDILTSNLDAICKVLHIKATQKKGKKIKLEGNQHIETPQAKTDKR